jgi:hypothetical protein
MPLAWAHGDGNCRDVVILSDRCGASKGIIVADKIHARKNGSGHVYTQSHLVPLDKAVAVLRSYGSPQAPAYSVHLHSPIIPKKVRCKIAVANL